MPEPLVPMKFATSFKHHIAPKAYIERAYPLFAKYLSIAIFEGSNKELTEAEIDRLLHEFLSARHEDRENERHEVRKALTEMPHQTPAIDRYGEGPPYSKYNADMAKQKAESEYSEAVCEASKNNEPWKAEKIDADVKGKKAEMAAAAAAAAAKAADEAAAKAADEAAARQGVQSH